MSLDRFSPPVRAWFEGSFEAPTAAQDRSRARDLLHTHMQMSGS